MRHYRAAFGVDAPAEIWPDPDDVPSRVSRDSALGTLVAATMVLAACSSAVRSFDWLPIVLVIGGFVGILVILALGRHGGRRKDDGSCGSGGGSCGGGSGCGGGCGGD